jgi:virulence-associated protein VapD
MSMLTRARIGHNHRQQPRRPPVVYAITFDLDTKLLQQSYPSPSWQSAYHDIGRFLRDRGFDNQQGSVYFGDDSVDVVRCQITVQELTMEFDWFAPSVRDIRMLRIEENNDLMPAVDLALSMKQKPASGRKSR